MNTSATKTTRKKVLTKETLVKQKYGLFTSLFYGIGNIFWAYAANFRAIAGARAGIDKNLSAVAGGFWITAIRETFYLLLFFIFSGPRIFKRVTDTWTKGGKYMLLAVFSNFIGNVFLAVGYVFLINAAFAGSIETSFIVITFIATWILFKQKFNWYTFAGVLALLGFLIGITVVQVNAASNVEGVTISSTVVGVFLIVLAQFFYMCKNVISEYVMKNKLMDLEGVQFMATFWSAPMAWISTPIFMLALQPILAVTGSTTQPLLDGSVYTLLAEMIIWWQVPLIVFIASIFLLTGRNCQYQTTRISGASLSNVYYQGKLLIQTLGTVIAYSIVIAITNSAWPVVDVIADPNNAKALDPWLLITSGSFSLWYYWVLLFGLFGSVVYTCISGQYHFEKRQKEYRAERGVEDKEEDYTTKVKGIKSKWSFKKDNSPKDNHPKNKKPPK